MTGMTPMAAALTGALISGVGMYAVGTRAAQNPLADQTALVQTADGRYATVQASALKPLGYGQAATAQPVAFTSSPAPAHAVYTSPEPARVVYAPAPARTVYQTVESRPAATRTVVQETRPKRSWQKSAMVIGGSAGAGAGVGALIGGKKGALIGTALGGGAASIYEATRRR
jgi:hypothetical protein